MAIELVTDLGPTYIRERAEYARKQFSNSIVPIYITRRGLGFAEKIGDIEFLATGVLLEIRQRRYLVTASHVLESLESDEYYVGCDNELKILSGTFTKITSVTKSELEDVIDCNWVELEGSHIGHRDAFIREDQLSFNRSKNHERFYMAYGFPRSKNKKVKTQNTKRQALSYSGTMMEPNEIPSKLSNTYTEHLFIDYPSVTENQDMIKHTSVTPVGMSGGALFDLGSFSDPNNLAPGKKIPVLLSGLLTNYYERHDAMIALDINVVKDSIKQTHSSDI